MKKFLIIAASSVVLASATSKFDKSKKVKTVKAKDKKHHHEVIPIDQSPIEFECPEDFELDGRICSRQLISDLLPYCVEGELHGSECHILMQPRLTCDLDFNLHGEMCARTLREDYLFECAPGYDLIGGRCRRDIPQPPRMFCRDGTTAVDGACVEYHDVEGNYICEEGAVLEGDQCITIHEYDCTIQHGEQKKKHGGHGWGHGHHRMLKGNAHGGHDKHVHDKGHEKKVYVEVPHVVTEVVSQMCQETVSVRAEFVCPPGSEFFGHGCRVAEYSGMLEDIVPPVTEEIPPIASCPVGYSPCGGHKKKSADGCCMVEEVMSLPTCEHDFQFNGTECLAIDDARYQCAEAGYVQDGDICVWTEFAQPIGRYTVTYECEGYACGPWEPKAKKGIHGEGKHGHQGHGPWFHH